MNKIKLEIREHDEAGNLTATYVQSGDRNELSRSRIDIIVRLTFPTLAIVNGGHLVVARQRKDSVARNSRHLLACRLPAISDGRLFAVGPQSSKSSRLVCYAL